ncbi:hypothetical protein ACER0A_011080 [Haloimpatiens sp. FM7315]|uniref:hypothetical protein n=1 Tax=Haloimpatiens sp. FM7315 TaxID=3298609 RepID=UPI0035A34656
MSDTSDNLMDILKIISAIAKDSERDKLIESIKTAHSELLKSEADSRRIKSTELIKQMMKLDMAIQEFEITYSRVKNKERINKIEAIEDYIDDIKKRRRALSNEKRRLSYSLKA